MRKAVILLVLAAAVIARPVFAQSAPRAGVFGGYQFLHDNLRGDNPTPYGWNAALALRSVGRLELVGEASGAYGNESKTVVISSSASPISQHFDVGEHVHSFLGGIRVGVFADRRIQPFGQLLVGAVHRHLTGSESHPVSIPPETSTHPALSLGGGVDVPTSDRLRLRIGLDLFHVFPAQTTFGPLGPPIVSLPLRTVHANAVNTIRAQVGLVFGL